MSEPIAIVGIGCLFPGAADRHGFWANIVAGKDGLRDVPPTHWRAADYLDADPTAPDQVYSARGGFLDPVPFDTLAWGIAPNNLEATDTAQLLALVATQQALADAGYGPGGKPFDRRRTSVILGITGTQELVIPLGARLGHPHWRQALRDAGVDHDTAEDVVRRIADSYVPWQENSFPGLLGNVVAGRIANKFDFGGTNCVVDAACASSLAAVHLAALELAAGRSDLVVAGGADTFNDIFMFMCFSKTPALSPTGSAKPFDAGADGTALGEGLGIVLLKRLADAERAGDAVYAVLRGMGTSSDGKGDAVYAPTQRGQEACLAAAYRDAGVPAASVGLVEAHGTGTKVGDAVEAAALATAFAGAAPGSVAVGSVKSQIGHTKAAAGAAGLIKAALALHHKALPPTIKVERPADGLAGAGPLHVAAHPRPWLAAAGRPRRAGVSSFGFGGSNYHAVLEEHRPDKTATAWDDDTAIAAFAGDSAADVARQLAAFAAPGAEDWQALRRRAAETRRTFRIDSRHRLAAPLHRPTAAATLAEARAELDRQPGAGWETPGGACHGVGPADGTVAALFPGQGSQRVGMLRDWALAFPEAFATLAAADRDGLGAALHPVPAFDEPTKSAQETALRATQIAQPALGAVEWGVLAVLRRFGVEFAAAAGHSYGELVALAAAGRMSDDALRRLSALRGKLMAECAAGGMIAVAAPADDVSKFLAEERLAATVANVNGPRQTVVAAAATELDGIVAACQRRGLRATRLPVSGAFHSPLVAAAAEPFAAALANEPFPAGAMPVFANATGGAYPADPAAARALLARQLASPVEFVRLIRNLHAAGVRTFVEVGPGAVLSGLVRKILGNQPCRTVAVDASAGARPGLVELARALAKLAAAGHAVRLAEWDPLPPPAPPAGPAVVMLTGANYVRPRTPRPPTPRKPAAAPALPATPLSEPVPRFPSPAKPAPVPTIPSPPPRPAAPSTLMNHPSEQLLRDGIAALQRGQELAADLHRQFLETQLAAQRTIQQLLGAAPWEAPAPRALPAPATIVAPPESPRNVPPAAPPALSTASQVLLSVVAEKTGYPAEMLNLDMQIDADLGIDSIKRVEILSALQEQLPGAAKIGPETLGELRTLGDIVRLLDGGAVPAPSRAAVRIPPAVPLSANGAIGTALLAVVAEKTGYPAEMLNLDMQLDADLGIDSIKRVEILSALHERVPSAAAVGPEELGALRTLGDVAAALGKA